MPANGHSPERLDVAEIGPLIAIMIVGVVMSVIVTLTGIFPDAPGAAESGTTEVLRVEAGWEHVAPAIAEADPDIFAEA